MWLASLDEETLDAFLASAELPRLGPRTITDREVLRDEVARVRVSGFALNRQEDSDGVFALAVPVTPPDGSVYLGSLSLVRPALGSEPSRSEPSIEPLFSAAARAAAILGRILPRGAELTRIPAARSL